MDLREKIAEVLYGEYPQVDHACFYGCQNPEHHLKSRVVDAVMGVVEAETRAAYTRGHTDALEQAARVWEDGLADNGDYATAIRDLPLTQDRNEC